jgi:hypothetical protein
MAAHAMNRAARRAARGALRAGLLLGLGGLLAACGGHGVQILDDSGETWMAQGNQCVRESDPDDGPRRRVINRVDPELCGRHIKVRSDVYVRVIPPPGTRSR